MCEEREGERGGERREEGRERVGEGARLPAVFEYRPAFSIQSVSTIAAMRQGAGGFDKTFIILCSVNKISNLAIISYKDFKHPLPSRWLVAIHACMQAARVL